MARPILLASLMLCLAACHCGDGKTQSQVMDLEVSPEAVDFGPTLVGTTRTADVTLRNGGRSSMRVDLAVSPADLFEVDSIVSVPAGSELRVPVTFTASAVGA